MLGLAEALQGLHQEIDLKANCRHGDLKPGNILHFHTEGEGILKITDFGVSRIHNEATYERMGKPTITRATTRSYEPPEAAPTFSKVRARSRKYDIWSLGCIFLEFIIWLVRDLEDVKSFNDSRKLESTGEGSYAHFYQITNSTAQVHPEVLRRITSLKEVTQSKDGTALGDLLDLIKSKLLEVQVDDHLDATQLCSQLGSIVQKAKSNPIYLFNNGTMDAVP
jgi:serine/threonine protein kinase